MRHILQKNPAAARAFLQVMRKRDLHQQRVDLSHLWRANTALNPYKYTSGRWLHHEEVQLRARYIDFDFNALCQKAIEACPGASQVVNYEKKEGGFNRVFILHMDNASKMIARIPFHNSGHLRMTTCSEVATMSYVRSVTSLPVPEVLDWNGDAENAVCTPYIIMNHVHGVPLQERWPTMDTVQKIGCVEKLSRCMKELGNLKFPGFGSIYFPSSLPTTEETIDIGSGFCIGPHCGTDFWPCTSEDPRYYQRRNPNRGPWKGLEAYGTGLLDAGYSRLPPGPNVQDDFGATAQEHLNLLGVSEALMKALLQTEVVQDISTPTLLHKDFHKRNIYVSDDDPQVVTAIIDWQSTSIEPMFFYARETPDFVQHAPDFDLRDFLGPDAKDSSDDPISEREHQKLKTEIELCQKTYTTVIRALLPRLWTAMQIDQSYINLFRYCDSSWQDGGVALREQLLVLSNQWQDLGLPGVCPYQPSQEEISTHNKEWEDYKTVHKLRSFMFKLVGSNSDGWVPNEHWEEAQNACREGFELWMETVMEEADSTMTKERAKRLWPFDDTLASVK
ncbi:kinase subdomain-containing protein [Microthyrium microscopicum]|uniref:Altered inheritance of mitochondria protein 9, mitochondrial n=1 Tax=Microthyrium microscopicum TaxID=703497 RepID=A0A6A6TWA9_9PEZI|nr:kinase subdomain-containing protein [Microthyrium microscopicum]